MRLDHYLKEHGFFSSREKAKEAILNGFVLIDQKMVKKPSYEISNESIEVISKYNYVSRSAMKLKEALDYFSLDFKDQTLLDIGASTGGFSQVALEYQAKKVYALDVGHDQLAEILKNDERIISIENTHFLHTQKEDFDSIDTILCDVSFISSIKILEHVKNQFNPDRCLVLFKPQFESHKKLKNPVIKNPKQYQKILDEYIQEIKRLDFQIIGSFQTLKGKQGNQERLFYLRPL
jgi:23S rRNA (cytidine1920-2'-O)/16S rRNA (cytidine1409-2'-O)-methyltransferase